MNSFKNRQYGYLLRVVFLSIVSCLPVFTASVEHAMMRDLVIILDEIDESNPSKGGACLLNVSKALMAESVPFLVNASLWRVFLELRQEWLLRSQMPNTDLGNVACYFESINERINYWHSVLSMVSTDELHIRSLIADKINEEFFTKEKCKKWQDTCKLPDNYNYLYIMVLCARFAIRYNFENWYWFRLDSGYYLAIPKTYASQYTDSASHTDILNSCGFNARDAIAVDPLQYDPIKDSTIASVESTITPSLKGLLLPDKQYIWSLYMGGHGCCYTVDTHYRQRITGITAEKFKELCRLFDTQLLVHVLWISTCSVGGLNRLYLSDAQKYNYTMVIESVGDLSTKSNFDINVLNPKSNPLFYCTRDYIRKGPDNKWELWYDNPECITEFFERIHELYNSTENSTEAIQEFIYDTVAVITPGVYLQNTPYVLLPQSSTWLLCCPAHRTFLDVHAALLREACDAPYVLHSKTVFIDAPVFKAGLHMIDKNVEFMVIITPGDSTHYIGPVNASGMEIERFLNCFWPSHWQQFTKQVLFESITCQCNPEDPLTKILGVTEKTVTFKDVLMRIIKTEQIDLVFTAPNGDVFYATVRSVDGKSQVRNLQKLSVTAIASYRQYYDKTKTELIVKADEAYAPLRAQYAKALNKDNVAVV